MQSDKQNAKVEKCARHRAVCKWLVLMESKTGLACSNTHRMSAIPASYASLVEHEADQIGIWRFKLQACSRHGDINVSLHSLFDEKTADRPDRDDRQEWVYIIDRECHLQAGA